MITVDPQLAESCKEGIETLMLELPYGVDTSMFTVDPQVAEF